MLGYSDLPIKCQTKIFNYLNIKEKGIVAQVCQDWRETVLLPDCWEYLDLRPLTAFNAGQSDWHLKVFENLYSFLCYIIKIQPLLKCLLFSIQINELNILKIVDLLITHLNCSKLTYLCMYFKSNDGVNFSRARITDFYSERKNWEESLCSHGLLQRFLIRAPNIRYLTITWNWYFQSFDILSQWNLYELDLRGVIIELQPQQIQQTILNNILKSQILHTLHLEVYIRQPVLSLDLNSSSLRLLNLSRSLIFGLNSVLMPNLEHIFLDKFPSTQWFSFYNITEIQELCWYDILKNGCPALKIINDLVLESRWKTELYPELNNILKQKCCRCKKHETASLHYWRHSI